ncbi:MAG: tetratricopeptide repeat protein, partial [Candidatus Taylorbacteria bacterium]|nr:tetratricopeptide repeat protein [Candidatus Taylorbacteria bacterium]
VFALNVYTANQEAREQLLSCASSIIGNQQTPGPTKQAFFQESMKALQDQIAATPKDARIYVLAGSFLNNLQQFELARPILEKAHALTPEKQTVDFELATNYLNTGSTTEAVALLKKAYEGDPTYAQARTSYGIGLMIIGKEAEARQMFNNDPAIFETAQAASLFASLKEYDKAIAVYQKLIVATPSDYNLKLGLARVQFTAGMKSQAIETMRTIEKTNPELKEQVEAAIKTI